MRRAKLILILAALLPASALAASPPSPQGKKPEYVVYAEERYEKAREELAEAKNRVAQLRREEAIKSRAAMARAGQWIEPGDLWREQRAAEQSLAAAKTHVRHAFAYLNRARDAARRRRIGPGPRPTPLSDPFWAL